MPETFFTLWAGGIMLAAAISDPRQVTLRWLRLAGIIALTFCGLAGFFSSHRPPVVMTFVLIMLQLAFVQIAWRTTQRVFAWLAFAHAVVSTGHFLEQARPGVPWLLFASLILIAAVSGIALMDMLLGHAYLTASQMTMAPFLRLNRALAAALLGQAILSIPVSIYVQSVHPLEMFWNLYGFLIGTRWLVGLLVPGVFVYMAHDCIKRRSTQSATGILYVAGVVIFIGEIIGLYLLRETGLPL